MTMALPERISALSTCPPRFLSPASRGGAVARASARARWLAGRARLAPRSLAGPSPALTGHKVQVEAGHAQTEGLVFRRPESAQGTAPAAQVKDHLVLGDLLEGPAGAEGRGRRRPGLGSGGPLAEGQRQVFAGCRPSQRACPFTPLQHTAVQRSVDAARTTSHAGQPPKAGLTCLGPACAPRAPAPPRTRPPPGSRSCGAGVREGRVHGKGVGSHEGVCTQVGELS